MLKSNNLLYNLQKNRNFKNLIKKNTEKEIIAPRYGEDSITEDIALTALSTLHSLMWLNCPVPLVFHCNNSSEAASLYHNPCNNRVSTKKTHADFRHFTLSQNLWAEAEMIKITLSNLCYQKISYSYIS